MDPVGNGGSSSLWDSHPGALTAAEVQGTEAHRDRRAPAALPEPLRFPGGGSQPPGEPWEFWDSATPWENPCGWRDPGLEESLHSRGKTEPNHSAFPKKGVLSIPAIPARNPQRFLSSRSHLRSPSPRNRRFPSGSSLGVPLEVSCSWPCSSWRSGR